MLVKINSKVFVLASDVISVRQGTNSANENYGKWIAYVKDGNGTRWYIIDDGEQDLVISEVNKFLEK